MTFITSPLIRKGILWALILFLLGLFLLLNGRVFQGSFYQDDWFLLRISDPSQANLLNFFTPNTEIIFYRPFGMQIPFYILQLFFGHTYRFFQLVKIVTFLFCALLVFKVNIHVTHNRKQALLTSLLFVFSLSFYPVHYWMAAISFLLGCVWFLVSFYFYMLYIENRTRRNLVLMFLFFVVGLFSNEVVFVFPLVIFVHSVLHQKFLDFKIILSTLAGEVIFLLLRFIYFAPPLKGEYSLFPGLHVVNNLKVYFLWSLNWPEEFKAQFLSFLSVNPVFARDFGFYFFSAFLMFVVFCLFALIALFKIASFEKNKQENFVKNGVFFSLTYLISISPVIFFKGHAFAYHMPIATFAFTSLTSLFLFATIRAMNKINASLVLSCFFSVWFLSYFSGVDFNNLTHWEASRSLNSERLISCLQNIKDISSKRVKIGYTSENFLTLNNQDAISFLYGPNIRTEYLKSDYVDCK